MAEFVTDHGDPVASTTPSDGSSGLWGVRFAVGAIVLANLTAFGVIEGGYNHDIEITRFATAGGFYLLAVAVFLYPHLQRSPGDGVLVAIALSLVGAAANLSSHVDAVEVFGALAAIILGPIGFVVYGLRFVRNRSAPQIELIDPAGCASGLWGIRLAVASIILANVIAFTVIEGGYNAGKALTKFSTIGTFYLIAIGVFMYPRLKLSPGDGLFVAIALSLVGATATSTTNVDPVEILNLTAAATIGPVCFVLYGIRMLRDRPLPSA